MEVDNATVSVTMCVLEFLYQYVHLSVHTNDDCVIITP